MKERHNTTIAVFGGRAGQRIEFKGNTGIAFPSGFQLNEIIGMAGNQVLEWTDLDTAIKTAGLKNVRG